MLRIHFTPEDLANTRVPARSDPLWETALSLHVLRGRDRRFAAWRHGTRVTAAHSLRTLLPLAPLRGFFPDFLTPSGAFNDMDADVEAVHATPLDLSALTAETRVPTRVHRLAYGDSALVMRRSGRLWSYGGTA